MTLWDEIAATEAPAASRPALDALERRFGMVPNVARAMAANPGTLDAYLAMREALGSSPLKPRDVEAVSLAVSRVNGCGYCMAAHEGAARALGVGAEEIARNLDGASLDPRRDAIARLAQRMVETSGGLSDEEVSQFRRTLSVAEMMAVVGWVGVNTLTNATNRLARTRRDLG